MRAPRIAILLASAVLALPVIVSVTAVAASSSVTSVTAISLAANAYKPSAAPGTTDDYHCTLVNPHVAENSYIISSQFVPGSAEDHHAALFLLPPSLAATAERDNNGG